MTLQRGLVAYYKMEGDAKDHTPYKNNGVLSGPADSTGKVGSSLNFDGNNDYIEISDDSSLRTGGKITVAAWFYRTTSMTSEIALNKEQNWRLIAGDVSTSKISARFGDDGKGWSNVEPVGDADVPTDEWFHVAMTVDDSASELKLYYNGELDSSFDISGETFSADGDEKVYIGDYSNGTSYAWDGKIDDVRIYNRVLTKSEVNSLAQMSSNRSAGFRLRKKLIAHHQMEDVSGTDSTPYKNNGDVNGATTTSGKMSGALDFDGDNDYVEIPYDSSLSYDEVTVAFWVYMRKFTDFIGLWHRGTDTSEAPGLLVDGSGLIELSMVSKNEPRVNSFFDVGFSKNTWHHVVATYNDANGFNVWVDGTKELTDVLSSGGVPDEKNKVTMIGKEPGTNRYLDGKMDDVRVYGRILSQDEVKQLYNMTKQQVRQV